MRPDARLPSSAMKEMTAFGTGLPLSVTLPMISAVGRLLLHPTPAISKHTAPILPRAGALAALSLGFMICQRFLYQGERFGSTPARRASEGPGRRVGLVWQDCAREFRRHHRV